MTLVRHNQYGRGLGDITVYRAPYVVQNGRNFVLQGRSLAGILRGLFHYIAPSLKQGTKFLGKELLKGGTEILEGLQNQVPISQLLNEQKEKRLESVQKAALKKISEKLQSGSNMKRYKNLKRNRSRAELLVAVAKKSTRVKKPKKAKPKRKKQVKKKAIKRAPKRKISRVRKISKKQKLNDIFEYGTE